jgi:hypothetical protein
MKFEGGKKGGNGGKRGKWGKRGKTGKRVFSHCHSEWPIKNIFKQLEMTKEKRYAALLSC